MTEAPKFHQSNVERAQLWLDECVAKDKRDLSFARVAIGLGDDGLYIGVTWLPGTVNGVSLNRESALALSDRLLYAAEAMRREVEAHEWRAQ